MTSEPNRFKIENMFLLGSKKSAVLLLLCFSFGYFCKVVVISITPVTSSASQQIKHRQLVKAARNEDTQHQRAEKRVSNIATNKFFQKVLDLSTVDLIVSALILKDLIVPLSFSSAPLLPPPCSSLV